MNAQDVHVIRVNIGQRRRTVDRQKIKGLAESISEIGLLNPITVRQTGDEYTLVAGRHRLEAAKQLGWTQIPAMIVVLDDVDRMLAEIDENLIRNDLNDLERSEHLAERKRLYLLKHPETKRGTAGANVSNRTRAGHAASETVSFAADTAAKTDRTERAIQQDVQIAESIPEDVRDALRETPLADSKTDLLEMARLPVEQQREVIESADLTSKASVRAAIAEHKPSPKHVPDPDIPPDLPDDLAFGFNNEPADADAIMADETVSQDPYHQARTICGQCREPMDGDACPCMTAPEPPAEAEAVVEPPVRHQQPEQRIPSRSTSTPSRPSYQQPAPAPSSTYHPVVVDGRAPVSVYPNAEGLLNGVESYLSGDDLDEFHREFTRYYRGIVQARGGAPAPVEPAPAAVPSTASLADWDRAARECLTPGLRVGLVARVVNTLSVQDEEKVLAMLLGRQAAREERERLLGQQAS